LTRVRSVPLRINDSSGADERKGEACVFKGNNLKFFRAKYIIDPIDKIVKKLYEWE
jgi:hypothetical protein